MHKYFLPVLVVLGAMLIVLGLCILIAYFGLEPARETTLGVITSEYSFDSVTIQPAITNGQPDIFHLEWQNDDKLRTPLPAEVQPEQNVSFPGWTEGDFMQVVIAFAKVMDKDIINANLFQITFDTDCKHTNTGFQKMTFGFFQDISDQGSSYRNYLRHLVTVDLQTSRLRWREIRLSEVVREHQSLDLHTAHLLAEKALQIAEGNGGVSARLSQNDECRIHGVATEGESNNEWRIGYEKREIPHTTLLKIFVDQQTGQGRVVTPQP